MATTAIEAKIRKQVEEMFQALNALDGELFYSFFSPQLIAIHNGKVVTDFAAHRDAGVEFFKSLDKANYTIDEAHVMVLNDNAALWCGTWSLEGKVKDGNDVAVSCGQTYLFSKSTGSDDDWKVVHAHLADAGGEYGPYAAGEH